MAIIKINNCGQGINLDLMPEELPVGMWSNCQNMRFRNGFAERFRGMANIFSAPSVTPYWIAPYGTATTRYWIHAGIEKLFADDGTTRYEITPTDEGEPIASITRSGSTATLTTSLSHGLSSGQVVVISGATPDNFNGTYTITVSSPTVFTYTVAASGATTASPVGSYRFQHVLTGGIDDRWTGGTLNGIFVCNNAADHPHYWTGDTSIHLHPLIGWDDAWRCKALRPFKNFLIALNITKTSTNYPHMVKWSDAAVPGAIPASWDETSVTGDAGEQDIAETPDVIVDGLPLGDAFIIYKERSMYAMTFIGTPGIFRFQKLPPDVGILARGCVANTPLGHVVLTAGDVVLNNGQDAVSIADGAVREYIFSTMNSERAERSFVCTNPQKTEVLICFPTGESEACDKAAVWNWKDKTWGFRDLQGVTYGADGQVNADATLLSWSSDDESWDSDVTVWSENEYSPNEARLLLSRTTGTEDGGAISAFDIGAADFGNRFTGSLERTAIHLDDPYSNKIIRSLYPRVDAKVGTVLSVSVGGALYASEPPTYSTPVQFTVGQQIKIDAFATGRFLSIKIESDDYQPWRLRSLDMDIVQSGAY